MSTKNIECQLAQGQIGRYLNGERFSTVAIKQLEAHVADCDECSELVTRRRQALLTMLGERNNNLAVVSSSSIPSSNREAAPQKSAVPESTPPASNSSTPTPKVDAGTTGNLVTKVQVFKQAMNSKPLLYCTGLAIVLLGMSYFSRGALKAFGPTVDQSTIAEKPRSATVAPIIRPLSRDAGPVSVLPAPAAGNSIANKTGTPSVAPAIHAATAPVHRVLQLTAPEIRPIHRRLSRPLRRYDGGSDVHIRVRHVLNRRSLITANRHRPIARVSHRLHHAVFSGVRIYDPQGRPIQ